MAPTYRQALDIAWEHLLGTYERFIEDVNASRLTLKIKGGGKISLRGAKEYQRLRGPGLDFLVLDEFASMDPRAWTEVLRPMLSDRIGRAIFIGTPYGRNHFFDLYEQAENLPDWDRFKFTTLDGGRVPDWEIEHAKREMDPRTFRQEYMATFETYAGLVYYCFSPDRNLAEYGYNPQYPLVLMMDFNVDPSCAAIGQIEVIDDGVILPKKRILRIMDEIVLRPGDTREICEEFGRRTRKWIGSSTVRVDIYGDATGRGRRSASGSSDWDVVRSWFSGKRHYSPRFRVPDSNPLQKERVNCVNSALQSVSGEVFLTIHPQCQGLRKDFEQVSWALDKTGRTTGEIDKGSDMLRTHLSDAVGYAVAEEMPIRKDVVGFSPKYIS